MRVRRLSHHDDIDFTSFTTGDLARCEPAIVTGTLAVTNENQQKLQARVVAAAESALAARKFVSAIDILQGIGWLQQPWLDSWRRGLVPYLERGIQANLSKISDAMHYFRSWAVEHGLRPRETEYLARTRDRRRLRFSKSGNEDIERAYRTHWISPALSEAKRKQIAEREGRAPDLVVIQPLNQEWRCTECGGSGSLMIMEGNGPLCLSCADMDHLVFLPSGDTALTRRAKKGSVLSAVVVRFSRARRRYERQGALVEEGALERAEEQCLSDEDARLARRVREQERRNQQDSSYAKALAAAIRRMFPGCPADRAIAIALHASVRGSGRIGRSAAGQALDDLAIRLAVIASVRHGDTDYDRLLMSGVPRDEARQRVSGQAGTVIERWRTADRSVAFPDGVPLDATRDQLVSGPQHIDQIDPPDEDP